MVAKVRTFLGGTALLALGLASSSAWAEGGVINQVDGVALHGFDPVAYFTDHKPEKGVPNFVSTYEGVSYEFVLADHKATFDAAPATYVPAFGGFCAHAVAEGDKADIDPHAFVITDGKLYVNYSDKALDAFKADEAHEIVQANHNWADVSKQTKVYH